jgi:heme/copper-type cytochrome/quinol oxidase subunit 3
MTSLRAESSVHHLPTVTFGRRSLMWWGTLGFMVIEGWTIALLVVSYLYLRQGAGHWPPAPAPFPSLTMPSINLGFMAVSVVPAVFAARAGARLDEHAVKRWLVALSLISAAILVLRWWDFLAIGVRWDENAYASAAWMLVGFHTSLLLLDVLDTIGLTVFFFARRQPVKALSDAADNSFYWYFTVGIWLPVYLVAYVGPRVI